MRKRKGFIAIIISVLAIASIIIITLITISNNQNNLKKHIAVFEEYKSDFNIIKDIIKSDSSKRSIMENMYYYYKINVSEVYQAYTNNMPLIITVYKSRDLNSVGNVEFDNYVTKALININELYSSTSKPECIEVLEDGRIYFGNVVESYVYAENDIPPESHSNFEGKDCYSIKLDDNWYYLKWSKKYGY